MDTSRRLPQAPTLPTYHISPVLREQSALVTGANSGIGQACAIALGQAGANVVVNYVVDPESANAIVKTIESHGAKAIAVKADVSQPEEVEAMFEAMDKAFGGCHILVNNAGIQDDASFMEMTFEQWNHVMGINLNGQFLCAKQAVKRFMAQGVNESLSVAAGKIVSITSVHQAIPWAGHCNYTAAKGGIMMMNKTLAQELAPARIRVNSVAPGAIATNINKKVWDTPVEYDNLMHLVPYGRIGQPEDVAQTVVWLASDQSDYVTGSTIYCDGGMMLYPGFMSGG